MHEMENGSANPAYTADPDELDIPAVTKQGSLVSSSPDPFDDEDEQENFLTMLPGAHHFKNSAKFLSTWRKFIVSMLVAAAYVAYVIAILIIQTKAEETNYWCEADGLVIIITGLLFLGLFYFLVVKVFWAEVLNEKLVKPVNRLTDKILRYKWAPWLFFLVLVIGAVVFIAVDSKDDRLRLQSLIGVVVLMVFGFVFSIAPKKIKWRHVAWGMALQFILGLMILRWPFGRSVFECLAAKVATFLAFTDAGSAFVFGYLAVPDAIFAFSVLPVILFFSFCIQILYYYGVMQWVVLKLGWFLQVTIGTTACESINAAANIFLGQTEAPLLIKPYIPIMTKSELHAVLTGGFATVAGSVMAAYISFGVNPAHLLSASVMSAPAALAFSKLFYPETKKSQTDVKNIQMVKGDEANLLHAAMVGVTNAIPLVANIAANLIAFYAFIEFGSYVFNWTCILAGAEDGTCSLESLFGWIFMPLAWVLGVEWYECDKVGKLIGLKTIINEFVAYQELARMLEAGELSQRAEVIATYALCGFSNISSIGINLGGFGAMAPSRRGDLAKVVLRAMIAGSCACFLTAAIAGTLLNEVS